MIQLHHPPPSSTAEATANVASWLDPLALTIVSPSRPLGMPTDTVRGASNTIIETTQDQLPLHVQLCITAKDVLTGQATFEDFDNLVRQSTPDDLLKPPIPGAQHALDIITGSQYSEMSGDDRMNPKIIAQAISWKMKHNTVFLTPTELETAGLIVQQGPRWETEAESAARDQRANPRTATQWRARQERDASSETELPPR